MRGQKKFWVHWNLFFKLLKHGRFWINFGINFRFWLVWVELRKSKAWVLWIFYKDMENIKLGHALSFYMHRKIISSKIFGKILGLSKAIRILSPPTMYLTIWVFCQYIFRGPCCTILLWEPKWGPFKLRTPQKKTFRTCYVYVRVLYSKSFSLFLLQSSRIKSRECSDNFDTSVFMYHPPCFSSSNLVLPPKNSYCTVLNFLGLSFAFAYKITFPAWSGLIYGCM